MTPAKRLKICESCPELRPLKRCGQCGCFMVIKTRLKYARCPLGKWDAVEQWSEDLPYWDIVPDDEP